MQAGREVAPTIREIPGIHRYDRIASRFTGYFRDSETGLDYAQNRYHQPGMGRFMTPDPYMAQANGAQDPGDPGSWNKYAYVQGDPINLMDSLGLVACCQIQPGPTPEPPDPPDNPCVSTLSVGVHADCAGGGGGGGGGSSKAPTVTKASDARSALYYELNSLSPKCAKTLPSLGTLKSDASDLTFWDSRVSGSILVADLPGAVGTGTIGQAVGTSYAVTLNGPSGSISAQVVLGVSFFTDPSGDPRSPLAQGITLLHELLHYAFQENDKDIDAQFGVTLWTGDTYSSAFTNWLTHDCTNTSN
jgi:RHS repeat-associated protein